MHRLHILIPALAAALIINLAGVNRVAAASFDESQRDEIGKIVKDYILKNPEIIREAIEELERRNAEAEKALRKKLISENRELLLDPKTSYVAGNPDGDVTVIEFFDYNCPYCRQALTDITKLMEQDKNVRIILKEYPILGQASQYAALVAIAARNQDKYMDVHRALMEAKGRLDKDAILKIAASTGLDMDKLKADMQSTEVKTILQKNIESGTRVGVNGTPSFIFNDELVPQVLPFEAMKKFVARLRKAS